MTEGGGRYHQLVRHILLTAERVYLHPIELGGADATRPVIGKATRGDVSALSEESETSLTSGLSGTSAKAPSFSREQQEEFEERAAIMQFDGVVDRATAEYLAGQCVRRRR